MTLEAERHIFIAMLSIAMLNVIRHCAGRGCAECRGAHLRAL
jgi:hypothetical protein